jgi:hypothetical protein
MSETSRRSSKEKTLPLISIINAADFLTSPKKFQYMLHASPGERCQAMASAARQSIFGASQLSDSLACYTKKITSADARRELPREAYEKEELTLTDGAILCLLGSGREKLEFLLSRTLHKGFTETSYENALLDNDGHTFEGNERENFALIMREANNVANLCRSIVMQKSLRQLPPIFRALRSHHSLQAITQEIREEDLLERLETAGNMPLKR